MNEINVTIDGQPAGDLSQADALVRAVLISLFTWRRAKPDDITEGEKMGWWGDGVEPPAVNDRIGSRLWLLARAKLIPQTFNAAREYAQEALDWLVEDGVASRVEVQAERHGVDGLALLVAITRIDGSNVALRFDNVWESIRGI
ncbi:MAG: phage GP46 family protein [Gallionella sp.]|nr:phage GP46 family protein [Gallionella sp.]